ncbi:MAG: biotin--[acetyl-CoA-carboxylase] ligase [Acetatifactor sp.]|nr:biotin--[acetyl-CoA-carboxylase] ligase [Acetatifactor sp.]
MSTREKLLELLEGNRGIYFSGEEIAGRLCISRAAVWKAVKTLQGAGYAIDAVTNKGYCLARETDILSVQGVAKYLDISDRDISGLNRSDRNGFDLNISVVPTAVSTNAIVRESADCGTPEGYVVLANEQTAGRGRLGRSFFSPQGTGIYMSLLLRPENCSSKQAVRITTMAAVAVCEAIEAVSGERAQIKWVNDIYVRDRKVCGILTEGSFGLESGLLEYAVLGIGINVYQPDGGFPEELKGIAGAVFDSRQDDVKNRMAAEFLNRFLVYYGSDNYYWTAQHGTGVGAADYVEEYRRRSLVIGKQIVVLSANEAKDAVAIGVDDECRLLVRYADGVEACLSSGEISIRL